jgi:hypothetical protein
MQGRYSANAQAHLKRARSICITGFPVPVSLGFSQIGVPKGRPRPPAPHAHSHTSGTVSSQRPAPVGHGLLSKLDSDDACGGSGAGDPRAAQVGEHATVSSG